MPTTADQPPRGKAQLRCRARGKLAEWLAASGGSLAITTYTSGKLVLVSSIDGRLHFRTERFTRPMGIAINGHRLALVVREHLLLYRRGESKTNEFRLVRKHDTGKVDAHDIAFGRRGVYFANTRFNAIARTSSAKKFAIAWQPPFIEKIVRGDRCHLNGLGMQNGVPKMATAFCATGHKGGWRELNRFTGGVMIDVEHNQTVIDGLCMPHSPRWHSRRWWFCNSGHGLLSAYDPVANRHDEVCELPGFTRGLSLVGDHALVGLSKIRPKHILDAPPVRQRHEHLMAGVALVDWRAGKMIGSLEFISGGNEVYEVLFLPNIRKPTFKAAPPPAQ